MTKFKLRAAQLDLARQKESIPFILDFIDFIADYHYNTLFLYLEWRVRTKTFDIGQEDGYSGSEISEIVSHATSRGIQIIPGFAVLGHAELLLENDRFGNLAELRDGKEGRFQTKRKLDFCPSLPETRVFLTNYLTDAVSFFPSEFCHVGGDESWDVGFCELCAPRAATFNGEQDIIAEHYLFCYSLMKKLGKRMLMWDDMFELYKDVLPRLPRDIIMVNWQYGENLFAYRAHFSNFEFIDRLALYENLGFEFIIAPSEGSGIGNLDAVTKLTFGHSPYGGLMTSWEKKTSLLWRTFPVFAAAGILWSGKAENASEAAEKAVARIFGTKDGIFINLMKLVLSTPKTRCNFNAVPFFGTPMHSGFATGLTLSLLKEHMKREMTSLAKKILADIDDSIVLESISLRCYKAVFSAFHKLGGESVTEALNGLDAVCERQCALASLHGRSEKDILQIKLFYSKIKESAADFETACTEKGVLRLLSCMPDKNASERLKISLRLKNGTWTELANGVFKNDDTIFFYHFYVDKDMEYNAVKLECRGYGGQGFCFVEIMNNKGRLIPDRILSCNGEITNPENMLTPNVAFSFFGRQNMLECFMDRNNANKIHSLELSLKKADAL